LGAVNPNAVLSAASTVLVDPGAAPVLAGAAGGTLNPADQYEVQVVGFNSNGYLTQASPSALIVPGSGTINVTYAPVLDGSGAAAPGALVFVRDVTAGETTYQAFAADNSGSFNITSHAAGSRVDPTYNSTGASVANFNPGAGPAPTLPTAGNFQLNGQSITIKTTDTLQAVLNNLNSSGANVSAQYNNFSDSLSISNKNTGSQAITLNNGGTNFFNVTDLTGATQTFGLQSKVSVNGGPPIFNTSNTVTSAISGVTMSLLSTGNSTVTISNDSQPSVDNFNSLVTAMNKVEGDIFNAAQPPTFSDKTNKVQASAAGPLFGNFLVQNAKNNLENAFISPLANFQGPYQSFEDLGLSFVATQGQQNVFSVDPTKLQAAIAANPQAVANVMTGLAKNLQTMVNGLTNTTSGLPSYVTSNNTEVNNLNQQIAQIESQANAQASLLAQQFSAMESALSADQALSGFLTNQFNQLSALTSNLYGGSASSSRGSSSSGL